MNKTATNKQDLERLAYLLHVIIDGHFIVGKVGSESVYACATLAREYINRMLNHDHDDGMIALYEANPKFIPMMFPEEHVVEKQIESLEVTLEMLGRSGPLPQHELMMMPTSDEAGSPVKMNDINNSSEQLN